MKYTHEGYVCSYILSKQFMSVQAERWAFWLGSIKNDVRTGLIRFIRNKKLC